MRIRRLFAVFALFIAAFFALSHEASSATPRRPPGAYSFGPKTVYTNGAAADFFNPLSEPMASRQLMGARVTMEVTEAANVANIKMRPALRWSADGVAWDTAVAINAGYVTGNGPQSTATFTDFSGLGSPKPFVQFGVLTYTINGSAYEMANVVLIVEPKAASQ